MDAVPGGDKVVRDIDRNGLRHIVVKDVLLVVGCTVRHIAPDLIGGIGEDRGEHAGQRVEDEIHRRLSRTAGFGIRLFGI